MRSTVTNPDMFFQSREANNPWYQRLPYIVQDYMDQISELTGRPYHLFDYYGARRRTRRHRHGLCHRCHPGND